jgi:hypothetical protein
LSCTVTLYTLHSDTRCIEHDSDDTRCDHVHCSFAWSPCARALSRDSTFAGANVTAGNLTFQRLVVTSDDLGPSLPRMRILYAHGAVFVDYTNATTMVSPILVSDRVVGYDTAVYGVNNGTVSGADAGCRITAVITPSTRVDKSTYSTCCLHCHVHHHHRHHALSATATTHPPTTHRHSPSTHPTPLIATHPPTTHRHSSTHQNVDRKTSHACMHLDHHRSPPRTHALMHASPRTHAGGVTHSVSTPNPITRSCRCDKTLFLCHWSFRPDSGLGRAVATTASLGSPHSATTASTLGMDADGASKFLKRRATATRGA